MKDSVAADLEAQIRNLERELSAKSLPIIPIEITVPKIEYDKLDYEFQSTRKRFDGLTIEVNQFDHEDKSSIDRFVSDQI